MRGAGFPVVYALPQLAADAVADKRADVARRHYPRSILKAVADVHVQVVDQKRHDDAPGKTSQNALNQEEDVGGRSENDAKVRDAPLLIIVFSFVFIIIHITYGY